MNPYSHLVIASKVESHLGPTQPQDYYWGAIAPDIRYVAGVQRSQTHLAPQAILTLVTQHPNLRSFLQGYLVHCLTDEIDLKAVFYAHFPFSVLKRKLSYQHLAVILEFFYVENEKLTASLASPYNDVLAELGLSETDCARFAQFMDHYTALPTLDARIAELVQLLGLENDHRIEQYAEAARSFQERWLLKSTLFLGIHAAKINKILINQISTRLNRVLNEVEIDRPLGLETGVVSVQRRE